MRYLSDKVSNYPETTPLPSLLALTVLLPNGISDVRNVLSEPHKSAFIEGLAYGRPTLEMINDSFETLYAAVKQDKSLSGPDLVAVATACAQVGYLFVAHGFMGKSQRASEVGAAMEKIVAGTDPASAGGPEIDGRFTAPPPPSEETPPAA